MGLAVLAILVLSSCANRNTFEVRGRIVGFGDDGRTLIVEHEDVPGLMPPMTMPFTTVEGISLENLEVRDAVAFTLHIAGDSSWISDIRHLPDSALPAHPAGTPDASYRERDAPDLLEVGDPVPQEEFLTHADTTLSLGDLEGKAVLLTFIYTRCPIPDFCPLMSQNFARLQPILRERYGRRIHLLSVSFDPSHDTPAVLRDYARRFTDDLTTWTFATGDSATVSRFARRFGEFYSRSGGEIIHNLVTVLIGPNGRIQGFWRGNDWQVEDVLDATQRLGLERDDLVPGP